MDGSSICWRLGHAAAVSVSSPAIFLQGEDVRSNVIPPGANLGLSGMNFWPPASDARRQAVNAMVLMDGGNPCVRPPTGAFADGHSLATRCS